MRGELIDDDRDMAAKPACWSALRHQMYDCIRSRAEQDFNRRLEEIKQNQS